MNFFDPYYLKDPTLVPGVVLRQDLRGLPPHLRFGGSVSLPVNNPPFEETCPVDSRYWQNSAVAARKRLDEVDGDFRYEVVPDETAFSWRMIYEMYAEAEYVLKEGGTQDEAVRAAHEYLNRKQRETETILKAELDAVIDGAYPSPIISGGEITETSPYVPPSITDDENIPF